MINIIIVTHNSQRLIGKCLSALHNQPIKAESIILVDSDSSNVDYLQKLEKDRVRKVVFLEKNIGFAKANNVGYQYVDPLSDYVLFLNPDAFPTVGSLERLSDFLAKNQDVGCVSGRLLGYDYNSHRGSGRLDSTGVLRTWYGRWYDRGQGVVDKGQYTVQEDVPAVCGAFLFCRKTVLDQVALSEGIVFDPDFFLYKEDIELCLRIRKSKWRIVYLPDVLVYHCRGWRKRRRVSRRLRLTAAESELLLYQKHPSPYVVWALAKYALVRWLRV